jgi:hypothetical protein
MNSGKKDDDLAVITVGTEPRNILLLLLGVGCD